MMIRALLALGLAASFPAGAAAQCNNCQDNPGGWQASWVSGDGDIHATEVRQFVAFGGSLYAATGAWMDQSSPKGSASILRLDRSDGKWAREADFGGSGTTTGGIASLYFTQSKNGQEADARLLVAATWSGANAYTRNETDHKWYKASFGSGQIRSFGVHKDAVANEVFAFAGGKPGVFRGQLADVRPAGKNPIEWTTTPELNTVALDLPLCSGGGRVTGFAEAGGRLFAAACWNIYERSDGPIGKCKGPQEVAVGDACKPRWTKFWTDPLAAQGESGLRGLTQIMHSGKQVLLVGSESATTHITRLDPDTGDSVVEFNVNQFLDNYFSVNAGYSIIPYNSPQPLWYGPDGVGRRIFGFESWLPGKPTPEISRKLVNLDASPQQMLGEGMFFVRNGAGSFQIVHIPRITPQPMTAIRDCAPSPFADECNAKGQDCMLYCAGFDSNKSTTQTPCYSSPCTVPPLPRTPTADTGFIVKGRITVPPSAAEASVEGAPWGAPDDTGDQAPPLNEKEQ